MTAAGCIIGTLFEVYLISAWSLKLSFLEDPDLDDQEFLSLEELQAIMNEWPEDDRHYIRDQFCSVDSSGKITTSQITTRNVKKREAIFETKLECVSIQLLRPPK
jgi:hypothetical protein